jgi:hypothetical protein
MMNSMDYSGQYDPGKSFVIITPLARRMAGGRSLLSQLTLYGNCRKRIRQNVAAV